MKMPHKNVPQVTDIELKKLRGTGFCALCKLCGGCTKGHIHCTKCGCDTRDEE